MHGAVEHHGRGHGFKAERANDGGGLPVPMGHRCPATLTAQGSAMAPGHLGRSAGLVNKHQLLGLQIGLGVEPGLPAAQDVSSLLLGRVRGFF